MIVYVVRFAWIAAHLLCLFEVDSVKWWGGYRWWTSYLFVSSALAVLYWPEVPRWEDSAAPLLAVVLLLRTCACLEALHWQTRDFPWWSRMMAGSFLFSGMVVILISTVRDERWAGIAVEYRRYLQIWTFLVMSVTEMLILSVGWWRDRKQDWHVVAVIALAANHARTSVAAMIVHPTGNAWREANWIAMAVDATILLAWAFARRSALSRPGPSRAGSSISRPRTAAW